MIPPLTILAAVDFSEPSRVALAFAARLARQCGAQLHVLHAEDPLLCRAARIRGIDLTRETREELAAFATTAAPAGDWQPLTHVLGGPAVEVICNFASREKADLLVLGMHGMSGAQRAIFGSTTEGVLRHAEVPVLAVPATWKPPHADGADLRGIGPVIAAVDFSPPSLAAAAAAARLARTLSTSLEVIHVVADLQVPTRWQAHAEAAARERMELARRDLTAALHGVPLDVPLQVHVESGRVPEAVAAEAAPIGSRHPLLVLGRRTHAQRGLGPGATAYRVLTQVKVPVLMYQPEA